MRKPLLALLLVLTFGCEKKRNRDVDFLVRFSVSWAKDAATYRELKELRGGEMDGYMEGIKKPPRVH